MQGSMFDDPRLQQQGRPQGNVVMSDIPAGSNSALRRLLEEEQTVEGEYFEAQRAFEAVTSKRNALRDEIDKEIKKRQERLMQDVHPMSNNTSRYTD